jgi:hypothetical protein
VEVEPRPRSFQVAVSELERPQVVESMSGVGGQRSAARIATRQDQRIQTASVPRDSLVFGSPRV